MSEIDRYADWMGEGRHDDGPAPEVEEQFDVFVYGTLRRGEPNHGWFLEDSEFLGKARTAGRLVNLGAFPGLLEDPTTEVEGEVYRVTATTLAGLDQLEGHPHMYQRREVDARLITGQTVLVQVYVFRPKDWPHRALPLIDGAYDWTRRV